MWFIFLSIRFFFILLNSIWSSIILCTNNFFKRIIKFAFRTIWGSLHTQTKQNKTQSPIYPTPICKKTAWKYRFDLVLSIPCSVHFPQDSVRSFTNTALLRDYSSIHIPKLSMRTHPQQLAALTKPSFVLPWLVVLNLLLLPTHRCSILVKGFVISASHAYFLVLQRLRVSSRSCLLSPASSVISWRHYANFPHHSIFIPDLP